MCRHLAYLGPPLSLAELLLEPERSLLRQTWAPQDMRGTGTVNADGFGVGWYVDPAGAPGTDEHGPDRPGEPVRYRRAVPMWSDSTFPDLARTVRSGTVLAAARNGTVGMPVLETACAPFTEHRWLFSHNGVVTGWPDSVAHLAQALPVTDLMLLEAPTDSALLWALLRHRLRKGCDVAESVAAVTAEVGAAAPGSRLNLLATDGETVAATTWGHALSVRRHGAGDRRSGSVLISSEPTDDTSSWEPVPDRALVVATRDDLRTSPLDEGSQP